MGFSLPCLSLLSPSLALLLHEGMFPPGDWDFDDAESGDRKGEGNKLNRKEARGGIRTAPKSWYKINWDVWGKMVYVWDKEGLLGCISVNLYKFYGSWTLRYGRVDLEIFDLELKTVIIVPCSFG